ncbi:MAG: tRNA epoxyqueuosine(34) reductase QueG [Bacteroidota bacterium]
MNLSQLVALKEAIRTAGYQLGLDLVGFAPARYDRDLEQHLVELQSVGYLSQFLPGEPSAHADPERVLPGARSTIAGAVSYLAPVEALEDDDENGTHGLRGRLARYTWVPDYHPLLRSRLQALAERLPQITAQQITGQQVRAAILVDSGSLLDRVAAVAAGLGWIGKNGCLINPIYGSWLVLGQIVTDLPLPPDEPIPGRCGRCERCLRTCPTQALVSPGVLEARRCVSEWTQRHGDVPEDLRPRFGNFIFGCDICQDVCPWNQKARPGRWAQEQSEPIKRDQAFPRLDALLNRSRRELEAELHGRAHGWRGSRVLQRNAIIALGNSGDPAAIELLEQALTSNSPVLRSHARGALACLRKTLPSDSPQYPVWEEHIGRLLAASPADRPERKP